MEKIFLYKRQPRNYKASAGEVKHIFIKRQRTAQKIPTIKGLIREVIQNQYNTFAAINRICGGRSGTGREFAAVSPVSNNSNNSIQWVFINVQA
jgi:hypothetical protein